VNLTIKVAHSALHISLSLWERVGVRETSMAHATYISRVGAGAMIVRRLCAPCAVALLLLAAPAPALQIRWDGAYYNPSPETGDVILPMPCGGAMAFRTVGVEAEGPLDDRTLELGSDEAPNAYAEHSHSAHLAGAFAWPDGSGRALLVGKYEVDALQSAAAAANAAGRPCPTPAAAGRLPRVQVGWYDAVTFAHRYSLWLAERAAQIPDCEAGASPCLPRVDGAPAFIRLPTEAEWEYAARGGAAVTPSEFRALRPPMPGGIDYYAWYLNNSDGALKPIGARRPSPLGLHDMLGNAEELVLERFRLNRLERLQGQAGASIVRGGSIHSSAEELRSSLRREVPEYDAQGAIGTDDTGYRVVAAVPVLTSARRIEEVAAAWQRLGSDRPAPELEPAPILPEQPLEDPLAELSALARAQSDPALRTRLERVRGLIAADAQRFLDQRKRTARETLRFGGLLCQKLHDDAHNLRIARERLDLCVKSFGKSEARCERLARALAEDGQVQRENLRLYADAVVRTAENFGGNREMLDAQGRGLEEELGRRNSRALAVYPRTFLGQVVRYTNGPRVEDQLWLDQCAGL
jgi:hypothetical protein